jgi:hypothetical protein
MKIFAMQCFLDIYWLGNICTGVGSYLISTLSSFSGKKKDNKVQILKDMFYTQFHSLTRSSYGNRVDNHEDDGFPLYSMQRKYLFL